MKKLFYITLAVLLSACSDSKPEELSSEVRENYQYDLAIQEKLADNFPALSAGKNVSSVQYTDAQVKLGHFLYFDTRLSKQGKNSCNSCHNLATFGVDNLANSPGDAGKNGNRNSPTVLNAALHSFQFWDGRAKDIEEQAGMPILNPVEMAIPDKDFLIKKLAQTDLYPDLFSAAFPNEKNPLTYVNLQKAIGAFERTLITPSRFDQYLAGDSSALTLLEKKGLMTFFTVGCATCHTGTLLGGTSFQKFGVHADYWKYTHSLNHDAGLFDLNKDSTQKFVFKVPALRNIEKTFPYFHDGSVSELKDAVRIMAKVQLDYELSESETEKITAFLGSLTGEVPLRVQKAPVGL